MAAHPDYVDLIGRKVLKFDATPVVEAIEVLRQFNVNVATLRSVDQIAADTLGTDTPFRSLEVGVSQVGFLLEPNLSSVSWNEPISPLPAEFSPYALFDRLFSDSLADAIARLHESRPREVRGTVPAEFTLDEMVARIVRVYEEVTSGSVGRAPS